MYEVSTGTNGRTEAQEKSHSVAKRNHAAIHGVRVLDRQEKYAGVTAVCACVHTRNEVCTVTHCTVIVSKRLNGVNRASFTANDIWLCKWPEGYPRPIA